MHTFQKKQIAVAVGTAFVAVAAGSALAAPTLRASGGVVTNNNLNAADIQSLYGASPVALTAGKKINVKVYLVADSSTSQGRIVFADSVGSAGAAVKFGVNDTSSNHIQFYTLDSAGAKVSIDSVAVDTNTGTTIDSTKADSTGGIATLTATFTADATIRFKIDSTGALQYAKDSASSFASVKIGMGPAGGFFFSDRDGDTSFDSAGTADTAANKFTLDSAAIVAGHTLAPTPTVKTKDTDTNGVVDGVTVETYSPITLAATNFKGRVTPTDDNAVDSANSLADSVSITLVAATTGTVTSLTFDPTTVNWTRGDSAADLAASPKILNTGVVDTSAPFKILMNIDSTAAAPAYSSLVVESTGSASVKLLDSAGNDSAVAAGVGATWPTTFSDNARPILRSATWESSSKRLYMNFSEAIAKLDGVNDSNNIRDALENITFGSSNTTLAAQNFNDNLNTDSVNIEANAELVGNARLTLKNVTSSVLNSTIKVSKRLSLGEPGDVAYAGANDSQGTANGFDTTGGYKSSANEVIYFDGSVTVATHAKTLTFDSNNCTISGTLDSANAISRVDISCSGQTLSTDSAASIKDHFKVSVYDTASPINPTPTSAFLGTTDSVTVSGTTVSIKLPTALARTNMTKLTVQYDTQWGDSLGFLKFQSDTAGTTKAVVGSTMTLDSSNLPFFVVTGKAPLFSADVSGTLSGFTGDAKVTSYLAKWIDAKVTNANAYDTTGAASGITGGKVTNPGDKVATDLALEFADSQGLADKVAVELNKAKPGSITVYVELMRSNDAVKKATGAGDSSNMQDWLQAHARISTARGTAITAGAAGEKDPVYEVQLDPVTGKITGRLDGLVKIAMTKTKFKDAAGNSVAAQSGSPGLAFLKSDGTFDSSASNGVNVSKSIKGATAFNYLLGVDAPFDVANSLRDVFVVSVLERPGQAAAIVTSGDPLAANYVPWQPNILQAGDAPKGRYNAVGLVDSTGAFQSLDVTKVIANTLDTGGATNWQLVGVGDLNRKGNAPLNDRDFHKQFITLDASNRPLSSFFMDANQDMALTMSGNLAGVATEAADGAVAARGIAATLTKRYAFAWANGGGSQKIWHLTNTGASGASTGMKAGWSLISAGSTMPAACATATSTNCASHVLVVGARHNPVSWVLTDGAIPTVAAGSPYFVFVKGAVTN